MKLLETRIRQATEWFDARASRERWILVVGSAVAVYSIIALLFLNPLLAEREGLVNEIDGVQEQFDALQQRAAGAAETVHSGQHTSFEGRRDALQAELQRIATRLEEREAALVPPDQTRRVLQDLLRAETELHLVSLETLKPRPLEESNEAEEPNATGMPAEPDAIIYRHEVRLEAVGDYFATMRYLEALETRGRGLLLDALEYDVEQYPQARITLTVYTLSFDEAWIGV